MDNSSWNIKNITGCFVVDDSLCQLLVPEYQELLRLFTGEMFIFEKLCNHFLTLLENGAVRNFLTLGGIF